jgi:hypothetical protein
VKRIRRMIANALTLLADALEGQARAIQGYSRENTSQSFRDQMVEAAKEVNSKAGFCKNLQFTMHGNTRYDFVMLSNEFLNELLAKSGIRISWTRQ